MKVHLIKKLSIEEFISKNARSRSSFEEWLFVKWIGTHSEYDKLCKKGQQYLVSDY